MKKSMFRLLVALSATALMSSCTLLRSLEDATMQLYPGQSMSEVKKIMRGQSKVAGFEEDGTVVWQCYTKDLYVLIRFRDGRLVSVIPIQKPIYPPLPSYPPHDKPQE